ncbi:hypothetical protein [Planktosalinus lacus]|uniref:Uncharacterized protein n=1 Tax=Planktosalinus lacus TaxID=1526573 RepID=A0A8J2V9Q6_9FLAO|nr:hypothetical protein [Planktosalinus lacus]GGD93947.1 hypothetical protein GCM10011312_17090 [Planktosalinus lacus]
MNSNNKSLKNTFTAFIVLFFVTISIGQTKADLKVISNAEETKTTFIKSNPELADLILDSHAYVIFPELKEGTYAKEGVSGKGAVYSNGKVIGIAQVTQPDSGFDLEGQTFSELVLFENETQFERMKEDNLKLITDMHGVMMEKGQTKSMQFRDGMTVVTMPHNQAQIEITVAGQSFSFKKFK